MVSIPITTVPSGQLRVIPIGTTVMDAASGGQIIVNDHGTIRGESRAGSIVQATSALPRFQGPAPPYAYDNRPYTGPGTVEGGGPGPGYPVMDYNQFGTGLVMGPYYAVGHNLQEYRNFTVHGNQPGMPEFPYGSLDERAIIIEEGSGIWTTGANSKVIECDAYNFRGSGIRMNIWSNSLDEQLKTTMGLVESCSISRCWTGIFVDYEDTQVYGCMASDCRDSGLWCIRGQLQSANNHFYGAQWAMRLGLQYNYTSLTGAGCKSINDTLADAPIGLYAAFAPHSQFWGTFFQRCWVSSAYCPTPIHFYDPWCRIPRSSAPTVPESSKPNITGIELHYPSSSIHGGTFLLNDMPGGWGYTTPGPPPVYHEREFSTAGGIDTSPDYCGCKAVVLGNGEMHIDGATFIAKGGSVMSTVDATHQKQIGIYFRYIGTPDSAYNKWQWGTTVTNCKFIDFEHANSYGVYVQPAPTSPSATNHAWRGGGHRVSIWGRGDPSQPHGIGVNDKRIFLPNGWRMAGGAPLGPNRVWLNGEELLLHDTGYPS